MPVFIHKALKIKWNICAQCNMLIKKFTNVKFLKDSMFFFR